MTFSETPRRPDLPRSTSSEEAPASTDASGTEAIGSTDARSFGSVSGGRLERNRARRNRATALGVLAFVGRTIGAAFGLLVLWIFSILVALALFVALLAAVLWWISPK
jgi:hypothetical protein